MKSRKNLTLYFSNVERVHLGKDVFLVPYYLGKELGYNVRILYPMTSTNKSLPSKYRGATLLPISYKGEPIKNRYIWRLIFLLMWIKYILPSDVFMEFHYYYLKNIIMGVLYKLLHPRGKLYLKMDASLIALKDQDDYKSSLEKIYHNCWHWLFAKVVDCITCETRASYDKILSSKASCYKFRNKLIVMPNAFDDEALLEADIKINNFKEKKNQFLTVSRIDDPGKNTEMLLKALNKVDLKDWSFLIVGPYEDVYQNRINQFYFENPDKKENVFFTGGIEDKIELWRMYNESKVFVFTSRAESCGLVFVEANMFHDYLLSTDVGAFYDVISEGKYGFAVPQDSHIKLSGELQRIIDGSVNIDKYNDEDKGIRWSDVIKIVAMQLS